MISKLFRVLKSETTNIADISPVTFNASGSYNPRYGKQRIGVTGKGQDGTVTPGNAYYNYTAGTANYNTVAGTANYNYSPATAYYSYSPAYSYTNTVAGNAYYNTVAGNAYYNTVAGNAYYNYSPGTPSGGGFNFSSTGGTAGIYSGGLVYGYDMRGYPPYTFIGSDGGTVSVSYYGSTNAPTYSYAGTNPSTYPYAGTNPSTYPYAGTNPSTYPSVYVPASSPYAGTNPVTYPYAGSNPVTYPYAGTNAPTYPYAGTNASVSNTGANASALGIALSGGYGGAASVVSATPAISATKFNTPTAITVPSGGYVTLTFTL